MDPVYSSLTPSHGGGSSARESDAIQAIGDSLRNELLIGLPDKRGTLKKMGGFCLGLEALKSVVDRWCELRGPTLVYYNTYKDATRRGVFFLDSDSTVTPVVHEKIQAAAPFAFAVRTKRATETFGAASETEYREWMQALAGVLETLKRFPPPASPAVTM